MTKLIAEMENMPEAQKEQLKSMGTSQFIIFNNYNFIFIYSTVNLLDNLQGMDPDTMLISMKMMKENPQMMATAQKLMSNMTPEEMLAQSKAAQEKMSSMSKEELEEAAEVSFASFLGFYIVVLMQWMHN